MRMKIKNVEIKRCAQSSDTKTYTKEMGIISFTVQKCYSYAVNSIKDDNDDNNDTNNSDNNNNNNDNNYNQ